MEEQKLEFLRALYKQNTDSLLFFSNGDSCERKQLFIDLFIETWDQIHESDREKILTNLEFIVCKRVKEFLPWNKNTPACTYLNKTSRQCYIIFDPFFLMYKKNTNIHILAHELAHAYYNHPYIGSDFECIKDEKDFIKVTAEPEAHELVESKWKIYPDPEDSTKSPGYKK